MICGFIKNSLDLPIEEFEQQYGKNAPAGVLGFSYYVQQHVIQAKSQENFDALFTGITATIPSSPCVSSRYDSVAGQKLLLVDWSRVGIDPLCPRCLSKMTRRSNLSKNKVLFPIFGLDGPPQWAILFSYKCQGKDCGKTFMSNNGELLAKSLPPHIASLYPVDPKWARGEAHITKVATKQFESILPKYTNGDLCAKLLFDAINESYVDRLKNYFSRCITKGIKAENYPGKDYYLAKYQPTGPTVRKQYLESQQSNWTFTGLEEWLRHTREMQSVATHTSFAGPYL
jgi:hypothetical protein